jgi:hypothetical protein
VNRRPGDDGDLLPSRRPKRLKSDAVLAPLGDRHESRGVRLVRIEDYGLIGDKQSAALVGSKIGSATAISAADGETVAAA